MDSMVNENGVTFKKIEREIYKLFAKQVRSLLKRFLKSMINTFMRQGIKLILEIKVVGNHL